MSFFSEAAAVLGIEAPATGYQIINYGGRAAYIEGFKRVIGIAGDEILLECKGEIISVSGEALTVCLLESGAAAIKGKIINCGVRSV
jgi:hypothetical protein